MLVKRQTHKQRLGPHFESAITLPRKKRPPRRGWIGVAMLTPFAIVSCFSKPPVVESSWMDFGLDALGFLAFATGAVLRLLATLHIGHRKGHALVSDGPYALCRHPLYLGTLLLAASIALFAKSPMFAIGLVPATLSYVLLTVPAEERHLRNKLGDVYARYCEQTPRIFPQMRCPYRGGTINVSVRGLRAECWRALRWVWIPFLAQLVFHLQSQAGWPHLFRLP
jgi:protein-S-isoprenylcysteine O-methyltransferase Ste14